MGSSVHRNAAVPTYLHVIDGYSLVMDSKSRIKQHQCVFRIRPASPGENVNMSFPSLSCPGGRFPRAGFQHETPMSPQETRSLLAKCCHRFVDTSNLLCVGVLDPARATPRIYAMTSQHIADSGDRCVHRPPPFLSSFTSSTVLSMTVPSTPEAAICNGPCMWQATASDVTVSVVERGGLEPPGNPHRWVRPGGVANQLPRNAVGVPVVPEER